MRLWTLHPRHLDAIGIVALWREGLLARKVLAGRTVGYRHHPQLERFRAQRDPLAAIDTYLEAVWKDAERRGYDFAREKIGRKRTSIRIAETRGQVAHEWKHLAQKLRVRDPAAHRAMKKAMRQAMKPAMKQAAKRARAPDVHPLFRVVPGAVREWERVGGLRGSRGSPSRRPRAAKP